MIAAAGYINYVGDLDNIIKVKDKEWKRIYNRVKVENKGRFKKNIPLYLYIKRVNPTLIARLYI